MDERSYRGIANDIARRTFAGPRVKLTVLSRSLLRDAVFNERYVIISITNPKLPPARIAESALCRGILRLSFHDINERLPPVPDEVQFTSDHARAILNFVREHQNEARLIVCQCEAGASRSAGVAAALSRILQDNDTFFFENFAPNRHVYRALLEAHDDAEE